MSLSDASEALLNFLIQENCPFSLNNIVEKFVGDFGKPIIQKALDSLVESIKVKEKIVGKHKIYYAKQNTDSLQLKNEMQNLTKNLTQSLNVLKSKQDEYRMLELQLKDMRSLPSKESLMEERDKLLKEINEINAKLEHNEIEKSKNKLDLNEAKKIEQNYETLLKTYRKRKRICTNMLDAILEGYPKSKKQLLEEICIETDEAVGFNVTAVTQ